MNSAQNINVAQKSNFENNYVLALALTCYKCDSSESKFCNYGLASFTYNSVNCDDESGILSGWIPKECVKLVAKAKDGSEYVARGCMPNLGGACRAVAKTLSFFSNIEGDIEDMDCFTCNSDKCNSAAKFSGYSLVGVVLAAVLFML
nr:PREDICTED: uncharacterized protein LOC103312143 [Tribolium castaneum]|eukprot:XP_008196562.1 PREDICTED: uncharacterized protein LOC103312143 [Tribolium castaneum]